MLPGRLNGEFLLFPHDHVAFQLVSTDVPREVAAGDDMQDLRDGKGASLGAVIPEICTGGLTTGSVDISVSTSENSL